jgi:hypothetical protein
MNGWRSFMWAFAVGLDAQAKIDWLEAQLRTIVSGLKLDEFKFEVCGRQVEDPQTLAEASLPIRLSVAAQDKAELAKFVSGYASFALGGIPAFHGDGGGPPEMRVEFWPGLIDQREVHQQVVLEDGRVLDVALPPLKAFKRPPPKAPRASGASPAQGSTRRAPLGDILYARSGDKGADANLGIWCRDAIAWPWVQANLNAESLRRLLGVRQDVAIEVHEMENVRGLMIVMKGYFGASGSGNIGLDPIGKGVGEFLRARVADIPAELLPA